MTTMNLILAATFTAATPLILAALGGVFSERSGVLNIGLEGIMLNAAFAAVAVSWATGSPWLGVGAATLAGGLIALLHAVVSIRYRANQVISGTAINLLALGLTEFFANALWGAGQSPPVTAVSRIRIGGLEKVPVLGAFADLTPFAYLALLLTALTVVVLYRTPFGLRLRAVGEHPAAVDTVGISVERLRYAGVILSGLLGGLAGASLSLGLVSGFTTNMTAGRGFIALAAMVFGNWHPVRALLATFLFGFADTLQVVFQLAGWSAAVPPQVLQAVPHLLTILALAGVVGRTRAPAAAGVPYTRGSR